MWYILLNLFVILVTLGLQIYFFRLLIDERKTKEFFEAIRRLFE